MNLFMTLCCSIRPLALTTSKFSFLAYPTDCVSAHRVILASGSRYLLEVFMKHSVADLPRIRIPEPFC